MGLLGRLFGSERPSLPAGGRAFVSMSASEPPKWTIRVVTGDQDETDDRPRVARSPTFTVLEYADQYAAWCNGGEPFHYPSGPV